MEINESEVNALKKLKSFFEKSTEDIKMSAVIHRALIDKKTSDVINKKVNSEFNSIQAGIYNINSKFNENSKNYAEVKKEILNILTDYEGALIEYSNNYDQKIEKLIAKRVELESSLVGRIFNEENIKVEKFFKEKEQQKGNVKKSLGESFKKILNKIKPQKELDVHMISRMQDSKEIEEDEEKSVVKKIEKLDDANKLNTVEMINIEKQIAKINAEINKINEEKILALENAMETKEKWIVVPTIKKPQVFSKVKKFFASKFNPTKMVMKTVILPLKMRVQEFKNNELSEIKE